MRRIVMTGLLILTATMTCTGDYVIAESGLCVRSEPSVESEVMEVLPIGTEVPGGGGEWIPFNGGYVASEWLSKESPLEYVGEWLTTAYEATGAPCACGSWPEVGVTLAHNGYPFGTRLYIEGIGVRVVQDRGPDCMGYEWCDIYLGDTGECIAYGEQRRRVWIVK